MAPVRSIDVFYLAKVRETLYNFLTVSLGKPNAVGYCTRGL